MIKKLVKYILIYAIVLLIVIFPLECIITKSFHYEYSISFILGIMSCLIALFLTNSSLASLENEMIARPKIYFIGINLLKLLIYALVFVLDYLLFDIYTVFTSFLGMISLSLVIKTKYLAVDKHLDRVRKIDSLEVSSNLIIKLKENGVFKTSDLTALSMEDLDKFLKEEEVKAIIESLKKYELFVKGQLGVLEDYDEDTDIS